MLRLQETYHVQLDNREGQTLNWVNKWTENNPTGKRRRSSVVIASADATSFRTESGGRSFASCFMLLLIETETCTDIKAEMIEAKIKGK